MAKPFGPEELALKAKPQPICYLLSARFECPDPEQRLSVAGQVYFGLFQTEHEAKDFLRLLGEGVNVMGSLATNSMVLFRGGVIERRKESYFPITLVVKNCRVAAVMSEEELTKFRQQFTVISGEKKDPEHIAEALRQAEVVLYERAKRRYEKLLKQLTTNS